MFTGIIEEQVNVLDIQKKDSNISLYFNPTFLNQIKIDQSISHNGVCLTVDEKNKDFYRVTLIKETLERTNFLNIKLGDSVNLERALRVGDRLDGHFVQGHIDTTAICKSITNLNGSYLYEFELPYKTNLIVEKGSITINGISLTIVYANMNIFKVAIIPFTYNNTNINKIKINDLVNIEFDILGKYVLQKTY